MCLGWGLANAFTRQGAIASITIKKVVNGLTCNPPRSNSKAYQTIELIILPLGKKRMVEKRIFGRTAKRDESPTSPLVNDPSGISILNPSLLRRNARILSSII